MLQKSFHLALFICALSLAAVAQGSSKTNQRDFSGTWTVNKVESNAKIPGMDVTAEIDREMQLRIDQSDPQIKLIIYKKGANGYVATKSTKYFTDLRGETNEVVGPHGTVSERSKTSWSGTKLLITYQDLLAKKDELELSSDGNSLMQKTYFQTAFDKFYILITYGRQKLSGQ
jgi:hypothetical protein